MADEAAEGGSVLIRVHNGHFPSILQASLGLTFSTWTSLLISKGNFTLFTTQLLHIINTKSGRPPVDKALILIKLESKFELLCAVFFSFILLWTDHRVIS